MDPLINLTEYYKTRSDAELLSIVQNPHAYQAVAVSAAQQELNNRQLTAAQLTSANETVQTAADQAMQQRQQRKELKKKVMRNAQTFLNTIDPQQASDTHPEKMIRLIVIIWGLLWVWYVIMIAPGAFKGLDFPSPVVRANNLRSLVLKGMLVPIAIFFFWLKTKPGWVLLTALLVEACIGSLMMMIWTFQHPDHFDRSRFMPNLVFDAAMTIFWACILYTLCRPGIRVLTAITKQTMILTIVGAALVCVLLIL